MRGRHPHQFAREGGRAVAAALAKQQRQHLPIPRQVGLCLGCDQYEPLNEYDITLDDGSTQRVEYCVDCAEAATTPQAPQILTCKEVERA